MREVKIMSRNRLLNENKMDQRRVYEERIECRGSLFHYDYNSITNLWLLLLLHNLFLFLFDSQFVFPGLWTTACESKRLCYVDEGYFSDQEDNVAHSYAFDDDDYNSEAQCVIIDWKRFVAIKTRKSV